ncbi:ester cyclase [Pseudarthrobacter sp. NIBRBAC000502772]|uniref:ester cyclase n=1 Tax=Pseudarthrobacter sp. NIBRBAC000502772 TaxID=2590775 RepID=UPI001AEFAB8A|nr:ester cyclase [Pseudarthrobacter sp. NIBRBAC000502772]
MNTIAIAVMDRTAWVEEFFRHVDEHDFDWVEAALTPGCVIDASGFRQEGAEVVVLWMAGFFAAFPDLRHRPRRVVSGDNELAAIVEVTGTHNGDLAFPDGNSLPPTGASVRVELAEFWRFEGARIAEYKVIYDQSDLLAQLGVSV